jgi:chromosome segregation ATPase
MKATDWLRRTLRETLGGEAGSSSQLDDSTLLGALDAIRSEHQTALETCENAQNAATRQVSILETAAEEARLLESQQRDLHAAARQVREALERAKLVALNAGLDGARTTEPAGRALVSITDEVRQALSRSLDTLDEHIALIEQLDRQRDKLREALANTRGAATDLEQAMGRARQSQQETLSVVAELLERVQKRTGIDPETARWTAQAADLADKLAGLLGRVPEGNARTAALRAVRPALELLEHQLKNRREELDEAPPEQGRAR